MNAWCPYRVPNLCRRVNRVAFHSSCHRDVCIIGGGVIGLLTARELLRVGVSVQLIEAGECGKESSWAGGGIVSPLYPWRYVDAVTALAAWSQSYYPTLCDELYADTAIDCEFQRSGLLLLDISDEGAAITWATQQQRHFQLLRGRDYLQIQDHICRDSTQAVYFPDVAQVRNPRLLKALKADVLQRGAQLIEYTSIDHFEFVGERVQYAQSGHNVFAADQFVVCGGAWSATLLQQFALPIAIKPIRGQMLMFAPHTHSLRHIVLKNGRYLIPRKDGRILCGSTVEDVGFDKSTTEEAHQSLWQSACDMMPSLKSQTVELQWAGLRPGSRHGVPLIGPLPTVQNLFINAGQFRNGVVLAPASARLMADVILRRPAIVAAEPYQLIIPNPVSATCSASHES